jgi:hypothetical protein
MAVQTADQMYTQFYILYAGNGKKVSWQGNKELEQFKA